MLTSRPQLRYTSLADMCSVTCAPHDLVQCVCCLRYLSRVDGGTILLSPKEYNVRGIVHAGRDAIPCIYIHQAGILQKPRHYACFICEPHMRRAQRDHSAGNLATVASLFVQDALDCVLHGRMARMDFFCVLKGCICLAAHVQTHDRRHYHPLRSASRDVLEGVIALMHFLTDSVPRVSDQPTGQVVWDDVAAVQEEHATLRGLPPIEEIIALARAWHLGDLSFPLVAQHDSQDALLCASLLRRAVRSAVFAPALESYHARVSEVPTRGSISCAGCTDALLEYEDAETESFEHAVLRPWKEIRSYSSASDAAVPLCTVRCVRCRAVQLRSFEHYCRVLSRDFPVEFAIRSPRKFYSGVMTGLS